MTGKNHKTGFLGINCNCLYFTNFIVLGHRVSLYLRTPSFVFFHSFFINVEIKKSEQDFTPWSVIFSNVLY